MNQKNLVIILVLLTILVGGYFFIINSKEIENVDDTASPDGLELIENPDFGELPDGLIVPNLDRQVIVPQGFAEDVAKKTINSIKNIQDGLKENPNNIALWLELGGLYKSMGDYGGAEGAWIFATQIRPSDWMAYHNLADLYGYYLKNPTKSEEYILLAIEKAPQELQLYIKAFEIYNEILGNAEKGAQMLVKATEEIPSSKEQLKPLIDSLPSGGASGGRRI